MRYNIEEVVIRHKRTHAHTQAVNVRLIYHWWRQEIDLCRSITDLSKRVGIKDWPSQKVIHRPCLCVCDFKLILTTKAIDPYTVT